LKKVIIIESDSHLSSLYELNLQLWLNCKIKKFKEAKYATDYILKSHDQVDLIICKRQTGLERTSLAIKSVIKSKRIKTPLIVLAEENIINAKECTINFSDIKTLIQCSANYLKITAQDMAKLKVPEYYPIGSKNLNFIKSLPCSVFKKDSSGYKETFSGKMDLEKLKRLTELKVDKLYIKSNQRLQFISMITQEYLDKVLNTHKVA
jgi:hypothetical protein